jgi:hypothetical protein
MTRPPFIPRPFIIHSSLTSLALSFHDRFSFNKVTIRIDFLLHSILSFIASILFSCFSHASLFLIPLWMGSLRSPYSVSQHDWNYGLHTYIHTYIHTCISSYRGILVHVSVIHQFHLYTSIFHPNNSTISYSTSSVCGMWWEAGEYMP